VGSGPFTFGGDSTLAFKGSQTLTFGNFQLTGKSTISLTPGTTLSISTTDFKLQNQAAPVSTTIGNPSSDPAKGTSIGFEGNINFSSEATDNPTQVTIAADTIVNRPASALRMEDATTYQVNAKSFTNESGGGVLMNGTISLGPVLGLGGNRTFDVGTFTNAGDFTVRSTLKLNTQQFTNSGTFYMGSTTGATATVGTLAGRGAVALNSGSVTVPKAQP
jgi:hypothetical protein